MTPSDYVLFVTRFPKQPNYKQAVRTWAEQYGQVAKVDLAFVLDSMSKLKKQKKAKIKIRKKAISSKAPKTQLDAINKEIDVFQNALDDEDKRFEKAEDLELFTGKAFITFEYIKDKEAVVTQFKRGCVKDFFMYSLGLYKCCKQRYKGQCYIYDN